MSENYRAGLDPPQEPQPSTSRNIPQQPSTSAGASGTLKPSARVLNNLCNLCKTIVDIDDPTSLDAYCFLNHQNPKNSDGSIPIFYLSSSDEDDD